MASIMSVEHNLKQCYKCGRRDHFTFECSVEFAPTDADVDGDNVCFKCGSRSHLTYMCGSDSSSPPQLEDMNGNIGVPSNINWKAYPNARYHPVYRALFPEYFTLPNHRVPVMGKTEELRLNYYAAPTDLGFPLPTGMCFKCQRPGKVHWDASCQVSDPNLQSVRRVQERVGLGCCPRCGGQGHTAADNCAASTRKRNVSNQFRGPNPNIPTRPTQPPRPASAPPRPARSGTSQSPPTTSDVNGKVEDDDDDDVIYVGKLRADEKAKSAEADGPCSRCEVEGHSADDCLLSEMKGLSIKEDDDGKPGVKYDGPPTCYECGRKGHIRRNCTFMRDLLTPNFSDVGGARRVGFGRGVPAPNRGGEVFHRGPGRLQIPPIQQSSCFQCGLIGHSAQFCPNIFLNGPVNYAYGALHEALIRLNQAPCSNCGMFGHGVCPINQEVAMAAAMADAGLEVPPFFGPPRGRRLGAIVGKGATGAMRRKSKKGKSPPKKDGERKTTGAATTDSEKTAVAAHGGSGDGTTSAVGDGVVAGAPSGATTAAAPSVDGPSAPTSAVVKIDLTSSPSSSVNSPQRKSGSPKKSKKSPAAKKSGGGGDGQGQSGQQQPTAGM